MDPCCVSVVVVAVVGGAALWLIVRYASVFNYVHVDKDEWAMIARAYTDTKSQDARQPMGKVLHRFWPLSYHRIFETGIYTDIARLDIESNSVWATGRTERVKLILSPGFVPFDRVVGIYDLALEERSKKVPGRVRTIVGLQVETVDFRTIILFSPNFDVAKAKAALMRGMGPRWRVCYRGEETLLGIKSGDVLFKDAHMHKLLRSAPGYAMKRRMAMEWAGLAT